MTEVLDSELPTPTRLGAFAARIGCTEGQLYSMAIALTTATALVVFGGVPLGDPVRATAAPPLPAGGPAAAPDPVVVIPPAPPASGPDLQPLDPPLVFGPPAAPPLDGGPPAPADPPAPGREPESQTDFRVPPPGAPRALTSDAAHVYAGTDDASSDPSRLVVFSRTGDPARQVTITGQPRERTGGLTAAAVSGTDVLVTDLRRSALLQIDPRTGQQQVLVQLPDLPPCLVGLVGTCQPGAQDHAPSPEGLVVAEAHAYIADAAQGTIWRYAFATEQLTAWYSSSDFATGSGPSGLGLDTEGRLVFTVAETGDPAALLMGALYRLEVTADGAPGTRTLIVSFPREALPGPVAVGRADDVYVGLRGTGGIALVQRDGEVTALAGASATSIPAPGGLSLASGTLYVADSGRPGSASSGRILAIPVADGPAI